MKRDRDRKRGREKEREGGWERKRMAAGIIWTIIK